MAFTRCHKSKLTVSLYVYTRPSSSRLLNAVPLKSETTSLAVSCTRPGSVEIPAVQEQNTVDDPDTTNIEPARFFPT